MAADFDRIEALFHRARTLEGGARAEFLQEHCGDDPMIRTEVESLLAAHERADKGAFLDEPATASFADEPRSASAHAEDDPHLLAGKSVGPYRVERFLGGGGMGDVYLAVRTEPFRQYVGLKIIRRGTGSHEVLRRFDVERQILASLNHTNIAKLLDGGITREGLPYFAMEYVDGMPITRYCDRNKLTVRERLQLFLSVCAAVQYAHQNLIIHRDLKPHNILVTQAGDVKLLDFGIAKIINPNLAHVPTAITQTQYRMLTPDYASPEQVRGEPLTTASDVYSLGVVLYELLVGTRPYDLAGKTAGEVERIVCDTEPAKPSIRAATGSADAATTSVGAVAPDRLARTLRGDLDNIVMMALRKEPGRRYQTVDLLLRDVERYLQGRPVHAHRDSQAYRVLKFIRRNRVQSGLAALVVALLVGFSFYSASQARKLSRERDRARSEAAKSAEVSDFVVGLFENANPTMAPGDAITVRQVLDAGVERVTTELADQPQIQAELFSVMATAYQALGKSDIATGLLARAIELRRDDPESVELLASDLLELGSIFNYLNRREEAQKHLGEFVALQRELLGPQHPEVLMGLMHLLSSMHMTQPELVADSMMAVWALLEEQVGQLPPEHASMAMSYVGDLLYSRGEHEEAERVITNALALEERIHGRVHYKYGGMLNRLAWTRLERNNAEGALEAAEEAVRINTELYPEGHRDLATSYAVRGEALSILGRYDEAAEMLQADLRMRIAVLGERHNTLGRTYRFIGRNEERRGNLDLAAEYYQRGADTFAAMFGNDYLITRQYLLSVADVRKRQRRYSDAESIYLNTYEVYRRDRGNDDRYTRAVAGDLADLYQAMGRDDRAAEFRRLSTTPG